MRLFGLSALALALGSAHGYLDASPFFMFSTSELLVSTSSLQTAASLTPDLLSTLSQCPSQYYLIITQQGVSSKDYISEDLVPMLSQYMSPSSRKEAIRSSTAISDLVGRPDIDAIEATLVKSCGVSVIRDAFDAATGSHAVPTEKSYSQLLMVEFPAPRKGMREEDLKAFDAYLASMIETLPSDDYTVLYTTSSTSSASRLPVQVPESAQYDMESELQESLHVDLKRSLSSRESALQFNQTLVNGPLFARYQFFTPGLYMGGLVALLLLMILYVAISGVSSLQVTYAAFDKDSGPLAAKKQQ